MRRFSRSFVAGFLGTVLSATSPAAAVTQDRLNVVSSTEVLFENDYVRVQWHDVDVGQTVPMHSHPSAVVLAFANSSVRFGFPDGTSRLAQATEGRAYWNDAASHEVVNTGNEPVHNLMLELRQPTPGAGGTGLPRDLLPLAAAPEQHRVLLDNERVRVFEVVSPPGGIAPVHVHQWYSVFITVSPARLLFRDSAGDVALEVPGITDGEVLPRIQWFGPSTAPRSVENVDTVGLRAYRIELKGDPSGQL